MAATEIRMDQGSTLAWTQSYGGAPLLERAREVFGDAAFVVALLVLATGVAGFVAAL